MARASYRVAPIAEGGWAVMRGRGVISAPAGLGPRRVDEHGRVVPISAAERKARADAAIRALDALGDPDEHRASLEALIRGIDARRPPGQKVFSRDEGPAPCGGWSCSTPDRSAWPSTPGPTPTPKPAAPGSRG